jgi:CheY-like chemotaxis protein
MPLDLKHLSILIVEDTLPMQRLIVSVLESLGFVKLYVANNGLDGFAAFQ